MDGERSDAAFVGPFASRGRGIRLLPPARAFRPARLRARGLRQQTILRALHSPGHGNTVSDLRRVALERSGRELDLACRAARLGLVDRARALLSNR